MINTRVETIDTKVAFKDSFINRRCLILADGYYEWKKVGNQKIPFLIRKSDKSMFFFAGIYNEFNRTDGKNLYTTSIITRAAINDLSDIHDRMPIMLNEETGKEWLNRDVKENKKLFSILDKSIVKDLSKKRVSEHVNNVRNDSSKCIDEFVDNTLF